MIGVSLIIYTLIWLYVRPYIFYISESKLIEYAYMALVAYGYFAVLKTWSKIILIV
jgi:hypothetical protein